MLGAFNLRPKTVHYVDFQLENMIKSADSFSTPTIGHSEFFGQLQREDSCRKAVTINSIHKSFSQIQHVFNHN